MLAYVHGVSPVKRAKQDSCMQYYDMKIQTENKVYHSVSYRLDLKDKLVDAAESKSPVKIRKFKLKTNLFDSGKQDVEINRVTEVTPYDAELSYIYKELDQDEKAPTVEVQQILRGIDKKLVSVQVFVNMEGLTEQSIFIKSRNEMVSKKDVSANDETGIIRLTLWGEKIKEVEENRSYNIENIVVKEWPQGVFYLTTGRNTSIEMSDYTVEPTKQKIAELKTTLVRFPPVHINSIICNLKCGKCEY